jgi:hypothetical protein
LEIVSVKEIEEAIGGGRAKVEVEVEVEGAAAAATLAAMMAARRSK